MIEVKVTLRGLDEIQADLQRAAAEALRRAAAGEAPIEVEPEPCQHLGPCREDRKFCAPDGTAGTDG